MRIVLRNWETFKLDPREMMRFLPRPRFGIEA